MNFNLTKLPIVRISRIRALALSVHFFALLAPLSFVVMFALMIFFASPKKPINPVTAIDVSFPVTLLMLLTFGSWLLHTYLYLELTGAYTFQRLNGLMTQLWQNYAQNKKKNIIARWRIACVLWLINVSILSYASGLKTSWELALSLFSGLCLFSFCIYTSQYIKSVQRGIEALPQNMQP